MKRFLAAGGLLLCLMCSQFAHADEKRDAQIKAQMVENYLLWQEALKLKDAGHIISFESPDFTHIFQNQYLISKVQNDSNINLGMDNLSNLHDAHVEIKKLTIEPNRIVVEVTRTLLSILIQVRFGFRQLFVLVTHGVNRTEFGCLNARKI